MKRLLPLLYSLIFFSFFSSGHLFGQSVNCPQCSSGICEGESLGDYITFSGYDQPITITSVNGAAVGTGTSLSGYSFSTGNTITIDFNDGVGSSFSETLNVSIDGVNALFTFNQTGGCLQGNLNASSSTSDGTITSYIWNISQIIDGNSVPLTTLGGISTSFSFPEAGEYQICLTLTDNNGCSDISCQSITLQGPNPELIFLEDGNDVLSPAPNDPFLISYCNISLSQDFDLFVSDNSNLSGGGSISSYIIEVNGTEIYNSGSAPSELILIEEVPGYSGYSEVTLTITTSDGCTSSVTYDVYLGQSILPQFTAQIADINLNCPDTEIEIQTNISADNPEGVDYELFIVCDPTDLSNPLEYWSWEQTEPEAFVYWTPSESSCGCFNNSYYLVTTATHPCNPTPLPDQVDFQVALPADAEFQRSPGGNLCNQETGTFEWLFADEIIPGVTWCDADADWIITDENGINIPINGTNSDELMTHTFSGPGTYEVCLELFTVCGDPTYCETVCVNPPLSDVILTPDWNIPPLLCPGDAFTSELTYSNLDFCDTPEVDWELFFEGTLVETYTGLTADIVDLQKGEYDLVVTFTLADCGEIEESTTFEVVAPPIIDPQITGPVSDACEGDLICFDEWFCIDDCGDQLIDFELILYQGFLSDCDDTPSGTLVETITNTLPNPPYANCDPTPPCTYEWTAIPGQYTLWIKAENNCGPDFECLNIDIPFPDIPVISGDEEVCVNGEVTLDASLPSGTFSFDSCPGGCPTQGSAPGQFTTSGSTLTWDTEEGITDPGDYVISYGGDCIGTGQLTVTVYPLPEFSIESSIPTTVCEGDVVELDIDYLGPNALDGCNWVDLNTGFPISSPDCQVTVDPSPGLNDYSVTVTDENGCQAVEPISIEELTQPFTADCSVLQSSYCNNGGSVIDLTTLLTPYPTNGTLSWTFNGSPVTGTNIDLDGLADGTYTLEWEWLHPTAPNCPFEGECSFDIAPPVVPTLSGNAEYCQGETVTASISGNNGIQGNWNFVSCPGTCPTDAVFSPFTFSWITNENDDAGTYILEYSGACLETVTYTFVLNAIPAFTIATDPGEVICGDESVTFDINYTGSSSIQECFWVNENSGTSISPPDCEITVQPSADLTTYSVIVEDANGCENSAEVEISIQTQPFTFNCGSIESVYCDNETATINLADLVSTNPGDSEFEWFLNGNPVAGTTLDIESLSAANSPFTLSYVYPSSQAPNCVFEGECGFIITDLTTPTITNNGPVCAGGELSAIISANNGLIGTWAFTSCPNNDCPTDFTSTGTSLLWQTTATTEPGDYVLTYTGDCLEDVQTIMTVNELPDIFIEAVPGEVICEGDEVSLNLIYNGGGNVTCTWENLTSGASLTDNGCSVTTSLNTDIESIAVFVTDDSGCASSDTIDIAIQVQPFDFSCPAITSYCDNEAVVIDFADLVSIAPSSSGFSWFLDGNLLGDSFLDLEPLDPAGSPYELSYTYDHPDAPNCSFSGSCILTISALTPPFIVSDGPICLGEEITVEISQNNGFTGTWSFTDCPGTCPDDYTTDDLTMTWLTSVDDSPGTYTVQYAGNCLETVTETFTVQALPDFEILSDPDATVCNGDSISISVNNLGATDILSCEWSSSQGIVDALNCAIDVLPVGSGQTYYVEVTDINGCHVSDSIELNIQPQPFAFDCTPISSSYCDNEVVTIDLEDLTGIDPTVDFTWFLNGIPFTGQFLDIEALPPTAEPYVLTYEYLHPVAPNCLFSDSCSFSITDLTLPEISGIDAACINDSILLTSSNTNGFEGSWTFTNCPGGDCPTNIQTNADSLIWLTDASVNTPGIYEVQYTGTCLDTALFEVALLPLPSFNVLSNPGETVCAEDTITIEIEYTGASTIVSCFLTDGLGTEIPQDGSCQYTLLPENLQGPYNLEVVDLNGCINSAPFQIDIQEQPFAFDCILESTYCDNSTDVIELDTQISPFPVNGSLNWFINGAPLPSSSLDIFNLVPGNYSLAYVYEHGDSPFCTFSDTCNFQVTELVRPDLSGQFGYCQGETVELFADSLEGFTGEWINVSCPQPPCIPTGTNPSSFTWSSADAPLGEYVFSYEGLCLLTETYTIEILGNPTVDWTPEDATPCLNECLPFFPDIIEDEDLFGWEYQTFSDTVQLFGNEVCFDAIGNPEELDICLWAEAYHPVQDTVFTCYVSDCETITPVFSPDNPPVAPTEACPGVVLEIGVDYSFYDDCAFTLNNTVYDDCEEILIPDGPYGTFPYMIELGYSGCSDSLFGDIFIPQPPSAELEIEYDPCIPDVFAELIDLEGMALNFDWSVTDNASVNYDFLMSDDSQENPVPNPIPLSQLNLPTDTTFYIEVEVFNFCESLTLQDTVNYIASPSIEIDIANTSGDLFCLPQEFDFEIGEFATAYIDSVNWIFESIYDYGNISDTTYSNLQFPPSLTFQNNGQTDTVNVYVTAYNQCGLDQDTINFVLIPPNVYLEMPDFFEGVCPGDGIEIPTLIVEGDPFNGCEVSSSPLIPGLSFDCSENLESISVFIPESTPPGTYSIETTISGCGSSNDFTEIEIFSVPDVDFDFDDQVCTDTEVAFTNLTEGAVSFEWDFGEFGAPDNTSILSFPIYAYEWPGVYDVTLTAFSDSNCVASVTKPIEIFGPNPAFEIDSAQICSGGTAVVEFESQDDIISLLWEFVLPGEDTLLYTAEESVANTFFNDSNNVDVWNVSLTLEDIYGCVAKADTQVIVLPQPTAFFQHSSLEGCAQGVPINFYNLSTANTSSTWTFDNPLSNALAIKYETNPTYEFPLPGIYTVTLLAQNQFGCEAQFARILGCNKVDVYVPNAFTPDGNSLNEVFKPVVPGIESIVFTETNFYTFQVFDRWGLMVFETNDYEEGWAGTSPDAEFYAPSDVYIWRLEINFPEGLEKYMGHVTLVR